ncbi:MAG: hypothetical protein WAL47_14655 [Pyrinomonadaceae bacterium]
MRLSNNSGQRYSLTFSTLNLFLVLFVSAYGGACTYEENTRVQVDGNVPPTFKLDGSGHQISFVVTEIPAENQVLPPHRDPSKNIDLWEIVPNEGTPDRAWDWPPITYGKVPPGFKQKTPISGVPPSLTAGKVYAAGGEAYGANGGEVWFTITDNHSKAVAKPGGH